LPLYKTVTFQQMEQTIMGWCKWNMEV